MIRYKGPGEHSIREMEAIIVEREELLYQKQLLNQKYEETLTKVANWELPETKRFWDREEKEPMSYAAAYGTNGERDYMKKLAQETLKK